MGCMSFSPEITNCTDRSAVSELEHVHRSRVNEPRMALSSWCRNPLSRMAQSPRRLNTVFTLKRVRGLALHYESWVCPKEIGCVFAGSCNSVTPPQNK